MNYEKNTPRKSVTISGITLNVIAPFAAGQEITEMQAAVLNQTLCENFRNNFARNVKEAGDSPNVPGLQKDLDAYMAQYEFGVRQGGGGQDPIEKEALSIAREQIKTAVKKKGLKIGPKGNVSTARVNEMAVELVKSNPKITKLAAERVKTMASVVSEELELDV